AYRCSGGAIPSGPFQGMKYINPKYATRSLGSEYTPKVLGIYERELFALLERLCSISWTTIVNVGAGEGYYAVGFARRCPTARVVAFEMNQGVRRLLDDLSALNGAKDRLVIRERCEPPDLARALGDAPGRRLIICDVDGYELELLHQNQVPALQQAHLLV